MNNFLNGMFAKIAKMELRPRVDVFIYNDKGEVFAEPSGWRNTLRFPGGGVEKGVSVNNAAREEALEETGLTVDRIHSVGVKPKTIPWNEDVKKRNASRGRFFDGNRQYFRAAKVTGTDKELLGVEGDALKDGQWFDINKAIDYLEEHGKSGDDFADLSAAEAEALKGLRTRITT